jgi:glycerophosphoryl diester phosphodiesterase
MEELKTLQCANLPNPKFPQQQLTPGVELISLSEFFAWVKPRMKVFPELRFNIELKFPAAVSKAEINTSVLVLIEELRDSRLVDSINVQSFRLEVLEMVKKELPRVKSAALYRPTNFQGAVMLLGLPGSRLKILRDAASRNVDIISPHHLYVNKRFIRIAHENHMKVIPWTVNEPKRMRNLMEMGIDGIISDYPDRLASVYSEFRDSQ